MPEEIDYSNENIPVAIKKDLGCLALAAAIAVPSVFFGNFYGEVAAGLLATGSLGKFVFKYLPEW